MDRAGLEKFGAQAAAAGEALWGAEVSVGGVTVQAEAPDPLEVPVLRNGREETMAERKVWIRKEVLPEKPGHGQEILIGGEPWWVVGVKPTLDGRWVLKCESKD